MAGLLTQMKMMTFDIVDASVCQIMIKLQLLYIRPYFSEQILLVTSCCCSSLLSFGIRAFKLNVLQVILGYFI